MHSDKRLQLPSQGSQCGGEKSSVTWDGVAVKPSAGLWAPGHLQKEGCGFCPPLHAGARAILKGDYQALDTLESIPEHSVFRVIRRKKTDSRIPPMTVF